MATYYAAELKPGMTLIEGGGTHYLTEVTTLDLCGGKKEIVATFKTCDCHSGPARSFGYSPLDLVEVAD
jgi:hypothetical protein